jgi:hypothetical protein
MTLGQSMFAMGALSIMGYLALNMDKALMSDNERVNRGEFGITALAIAQSVAEEAMSKYFDAKVETATSGEIMNTDSLTAVAYLGKGSTEKYRDGTNDFNDFDDFNNLFLVYKSNNPSDTAKTTGSHWETVVPNLERKYFVKCTVNYVKVSSGIPALDSVSTTQTWHKRMLIKVINPQAFQPTADDTVTYPIIMSYWN